MADWKGCSMSVDVVDLEGVQVPARAVAAELADVDTADAAELEQGGELGAVELAQLLLDHVGADARDRAAHVDVRLVHRVAERVAGVTEHGDHARLGHEPTHVADRSLDEDRAALERDT